ncbi:TolC family protein [Escherichia coli]|nr:TolC family protein [Escherichia coli]EFP6926702.1 TolC family protein [Shigella dysenteriae]EJF5753498.1 TolC family protein [Shigella sonnei]EFO2173054.1 TolC family protein [Escherichia coli]EFO4691196.1 TolC family protein [Escherichia coli]
MTYNKYMIIMLVNLFMYSNAFSCGLEAYLKKSDSYKIFELNQKENRLKNKSVNYSFLPNIYIGMGQYINNDTGLVDISKSSFYISFSQLIFSGESLGKNSEKEEIDNKERKILFEKEKNEQLLKLYADIIQHEYLKENVLLNFSRLDKIKSEYNKTLLDLKSGIVPSLEVDVKSLNILKIENLLDGLMEDLKLLEKKISKDYSIPPGNISKITYNDIISCKEIGYRELIDRSKYNKLQQADIELDINNAALLPSVYLSIGLTPKNEGTLRDISLRKMDYNGGVSINIPFSNFFTAIDNQKKFAVSVSKARLESEKDLKELIIAKRDIFNKLSAIKRYIPILKREVELKNRKMEYNLWLVKNKKESILSYLDSQDELYEAEINLKKHERDLKYYQMYLNFIN